tara:strand:- start:1151 stop:1444 length:294 start_codon:yes stop_codon:yes gene_type:complete
VKLPKKLESLSKKRELLIELLSNIDADIDSEYMALTENITYKDNGKSFSMVYNKITFNFRPLTNENDYTVIKSGRAIGGVYNKSIDSLKLDIVKGLL